MRVFLSYASEQRGLADELAQRLKSAGVDVFFDIERIAPSDSFDLRIQRAVAQADVFVFLASSEALTPNSYALAELAFAQKKWPNASGRILTVLLPGTHLESLPSYLRSVSVLRPHGDVIAETVAAASRLLERKRKRFWVSILGSGLVLLFATIVSLLIPRSPVPYQINDVTVARSGEGFRFTARLRNGGPEPVTSVRLYPEADVSTVRFSGSGEWFQVFPGEVKDVSITFKLSGGKGVTNFNWRLCWVFVKTLDLDMAKDNTMERFLDQRSQTVCSAYRPWLQ